MMLAWLRSMADAILVESQANLVVSIPPRAWRQTPISVIETNPPGGTARGLPTTSTR